MAVPKRRTSKQRRNTRRSATYKLSVPGMAACPQCHAQKLTHRVCSACGYYNGRQVMQVEKPDKKES